MRYDNNNRGAIWKNDKKEKESQPDFKGKATINNIDYYVIINKPQDDKVYYDPSKTIVFQMEPWVEDNSKNWGVKTWGKWANPDPTQFLHVHNHQNYLNNVQWQIKIPQTFPKTRKNQVLSILSEKNFDTGHQKRIQFIQYLEKKRKNRCYYVYIYI